jgi:hypothetical protein
VNETGRMQGLWGRTEDQLCEQVEREQEHSPAVELVLPNLLHHEGYLRRHLVHAQLAPSQPRQQRTPLPLTLGIQPSRFHFRQLEYLLQSIVTRTEGNVGEVMMTLLARRGDLPEEEKVERRWGEEGEEGRVERGWDGRELGCEGEMAEGRVGAEEGVEETGSGGRDGVLLGVRRVSQSFSGK